MRSLFAYALLLLSLTSLSSYAEDFDTDELNHVIDEASVKDEGGIQSEFPESNIEMERSNSVLEPELQEENMPQAREEVREDEDAMAEDFN